MNRILVIAFALSSLLKPGLVLCVEAGGEVRMERPTAICCEATTEQLPLSIEHSTPDDCDGCLDFSLIPHSLTSKRTAAADCLFADASSLVSIAPLDAPVTTFAYETHRPSLYFATTTTVLRR